MRRKKWMTKTFAMLLSMILVLIMMPTMAFADTGDGTAGGVDGGMGTSAPTTINTVALTLDKDLLLPGTAYDSETHGNPDIVKYDGPYTVEIDKWQNAGGLELTDGYQFTNGNDYKLHLTVKPADGYAFDIKDNMTVTMNGETVNIMGAPFETESNKPLLIECAFRTARYWDRVTLWDVPGAVLRESMPTYSYTYGEGEDATYTVSASWNVWNADAKAYEPASGTFEDEKLYQQVLTISATSNYVFEEDLDI